MSSEKGYKKTVHNFYERQHMVKSLVYFAYAGLLTVGLFWTVTKFMEHHPFVITTFHYWLQVVGLAVALLFFVYRFHVKNLVTAINEQGVFVKWRPFQKNFHMMLWQDIREIRLVEKRGYFQKSTYSQSFDTGNRYGLEITSKSGRKKFISTNKSNALPRILSRMAAGKFHSTGIGETIDFKD